MNLQWRVKGVATIVADEIDVAIEPTWGCVATGTDAKG
jgi:hypothetical protein